MTIKSMTGPETGGDVAGQESGRSIWSAAQPELYPGSDFPVCAASEELSAESRKAT